MRGEQAIIVRAADDTIVGWTPAAARLSGYEADEVVGRSLSALLHDGTPTSGTHATLLRKDGRGVRVVRTQSPVHDELGRLIAYADALVPVDDVAVAPAGPTATASSDAMFQHVLEALPMLCWITSPEGDCRFLSSRWSEYTGLPRERLLGDGWHRVVHPDDIAPTYHALRRPASPPSGHPLIELRLRRHDGAYRWFEVRATAERDADGRLVAWFGATLDVHDMYLAGEALRRERAHLERVVAAAPGAFYSCTLVPSGTLRFAHVSPALKELLGFTLEELDAGLATLAHVHPDDHARVRASAEESARTLRRWELDYRMHTADRGMIWVQGSSLPVRTEDGGVQWFGFLQDITWRKRSEEAQLRVQKLEALGTLAGGIAHDFNNMLHAISGNCALALRELPGSHAARPLLETAIQAGERAADLVRRLLQFSRPAEAQRELLPLRAIVREALRLVRATVPARIEIHEQLGEDDPWIEADATQLHQIILHLAGNATSAIGEASGILRVRLERVVAGASEAHAPVELPSGELVAVHVSDSGAGMDEHTTTRVFDPFFTTKAAGQGVGAGLGLSLVHAIMASLGGAVAVHSAPGKGSTFSLYFPVREAPARADVAPAVAPCAATGGRVLLVDDEPLLVELGTHTLELLGYEVCSFVSPREALQAFLAAPDRIDVVITDFAMPGLSGFDVAKRLLEVRPALPIIMMSGNVSAEEIVTARKLGLYDVLLKPVSIETLDECVRAAMCVARAAPGP